MDKPELVVVGKEDTSPDIEDLIAMFQQLVGRYPTDEEIAEAKKALEEA